MKLLGNGQTSHAMGNLHASQPGKVPGRLTMNYIYLFPGEQLSLGQICISYDRTLNDWGFVLHLGHYTSINYWKRDLYGARETSASPEAVHLVTSSAICDGIFAFGDRNKDELEIEIRIAGAARGFRWKFACAAVMGLVQNCGWLQLYVRIGDYALILPNSLILAAHSPKIN